ncbi:thiamine pyrophosphate-binding protein [Halegenticoccus tardaugens]|uniref:thiamine pyrophosphate-binding protein n=1 Tax=Halegenticoccus tardaugens TaxID=2071624 RepID=UPI00100A4397|nr:thiamine pyrophosphate-binding protein [Halegenticoccus tardaugens]
MPASHTSDVETGSDYVLSALAAEGVDHLFGLIGEGNSHLLNRTHDHDITYTYARHEQVAVSMADGYARLTGDVGVCTLTHGPGVTNGATGIVIADRNSVPLVVLIGDAGTEGRETSLQYLDHKTFTSPISVHQTRAPTPATVPETIRRAFDIARTERGPVIVELPTDVQSAPAPESEYLPKPRSTQRPRPDVEELAEATALLDGADHPVVLAGGGAAAADAGDALIQFAETIGAPIATTLFAQGVLSADHPLHTGASGTFMTPASDALLWDADVVVAAGARLSGKTTRYGELYADADVIQVDIDSAALGTYRDPAVGIVGDARTTIEELAERVTPHPDRTERVRTVIREAGTPADVETRSDPNRIDPRAFTRALAARIPGDSIVTVDSGNNTGFPAVFHPVDAGGRLLLDGNFGTMGYALPAALGAQVADPQRTVVCYIGDGAFMQVIQDVETAARLSLPIVVAVLNDGSYGIIRHRQYMEFGRETASSYESPDFVRVAEGLGAQAATIRDVDDLSAVDEFLDGDPTRPLVLDVRTIPHVSRPGFPPY